MIEDLFQLSDNVLDNLDSRIIAHQDNPEIVAEDDCSGCCWGGSCCSNPISG